MDAHTFLAEKALSAQSFARRGGAVATATAKQSARSQAFSREDELFETYKPGKG